MQRIQQQQQEKGKERNKGGNEDPSRAKVVR
jgi:hypothetical protein